VIGRVTQRETTPYEALRVRLASHLVGVYPDRDSDDLADRLLAAFRVPLDCVEPGAHVNNWTQSDIVAITYGDSVVAPDQRPLVTLRRFFERELSDVVSAVHILPFFPYSSDDGFSVIDYKAVDSRLGDWGDVTDFGRRFKLMADLVANHASAESRWFQNYVARKRPGKLLFFEASPDDDLSLVVRPRTSPLLRKVETADGPRHVWCTFSHDQIDLDYSNPDLLIEMVKVLRLYLERGIKIFRLDAVAFLWKQPGTTSLHLPQTHEIIKIFRLLLEHRAPDSIVITETNVPNRENLMYFGNGNEAHAIYNFSLAPLLLYTMLTGDCRHLKTWQMSMPPAQFGTAYFNFIASHDGIGLRPAEGLLEPEELQRMISAVESFGGRITYRRADGGEERPYEINVSLFDAMSGGIDGVPDGHRFERFICAHTIMLALEGIPGFYIHSLLATPNELRKLEQTGRNRSINRANLDADTLKTRLQDPDDERTRVFRELKRRIHIRKLQDAFHPNATQYTLHLGRHIFAFWRQSMDRSQSIFAIHNVSGEMQEVSLAEVNLIVTDDWVDLISGQPISDRGGCLVFQPYQSMWLSNRF